MQSTRMKKFLYATTVIPAFYLLVPLSVNAQSTSVEGTASATNNQAYEARLKSIVSRQEAMIVAQEAEVKRLEEDMLTLRNGIINAPEKVEVQVVTNTVTVNCFPPEEACCFIAGTQVLMVDGSHKNIEDVAVGDVVVGQDGSHNTVEALIRESAQNRQLYSINGSKSFVTDDHPLYTDGGWKAFSRTSSTQRYGDIVVEDLAVGDVLHRIDGKEELKAFDAELCHDDVPVYTFRTNGTHSYYADGYLAHNNCDVGGGGTGGDKVLCTELNRQGMLSDELYAADVEYFLALNKPFATRMYHSWAIPLVGVIQNSPHALAVVTPFVRRWAEYMAYKMDAPQGRWSVTGWMLCELGVPLHDVLGRVFYPHTSADYIQMCQNASRVDVSSGHRGNEVAMIRNPLYAF